MSEIKQTIRLSYFLYSIITLSILTLNSCSKQEEYTNATIKNANPINYQTYFKNPYDTVGRYHNIGLAKIFNDYKQTISSKSLNINKEKSKLNTLILKFFNEHPFNEGMIVKERDLQTIDSLIVKSKTTPNERLSTSQLKFHNIIRETIKKKHSSPQDLIDNINKVEKQIDEDKNLSSEEKIQLLSATSVAKYSSVFWIEQVKKIKPIVPVSRTSPPPPDEMGPEMYGGDWETWYTQDFMPVAESVIWSDVKGGIVGAVTSFIFEGGAGLLIPGLGTASIIAIIKGAVIGAISNSSVNGIEIMWNIFTEDDVIE